MEQNCIDHIVYKCGDLEAASDHFEDLLGIRPSFGGYHRDQGTKNALFSLGEGCYFELIAIDEDNLQARPPRWMGVDLPGKDKIVRWAKTTDQLEIDSQILQAYNPVMGKVHTASRALAGGGELSWQMTLPLGKPEIELLPFLIDWSQSAHHPSELLEPHCRLVDFVAIHPEPASLKGVWEELGIKIKLEQGSKPGFRLRIQGPKGLLTLE